MKHFVYLTTLFIGLVLASCASEETKFDANLQKTIQMFASLENANSDFLKDLGNVYLDASENTNTRMQTEEYVYKLCNDFYDEAEKNGILKSIIENKSDLQLSISKLANPPSSRQECYDELLDLVKDLYKLTNLTTKRPINIFDFLQELNDTKDLLTEKEDMFVTKYGQYLNN